MSYVAPWLEGGSGMSLEGLVLEGGSGMSLEGLVLTLCALMVVGGSLLWVGAYLSQRRADQEREYRDWLRADTAKGSIVVTDSGSGEVSPAVVSGTARLPMLEGQEPTR